MNSRTSDLRSMQAEFEKKQQDYALRSQQLQQKLKAKYEPQFPEFKARSINRKQETDTISLETTSTQANRMQDFQQRQADFLKRQSQKKEELERESKSKFNYTPNINQNSKKLASSPTERNLSQNERLHARTTHLAKEKLDCSTNCHHPKCRQAREQ